MGLRPVSGQPLLTGYPGLRKRSTALPGSLDSEYYLRSAEVDWSWIVYMLV